ncbi:MAG: M23 family metallopeptidase [Gammaproteobacteria bacterium]|nr:M23 family metallopeptidase [Gammaproteobacteria bacterium]
MDRGRRRQGIQRIDAADAHPHRFGVVASCVVAGSIFAAAGSQLQNPLPEPLTDELTVVATSPATTAPATPFEFVAVTIGRDDTLDRIFRELQLDVADLAALRNLPDVRRSLDIIRPGDVIQMTHLGGELKSLTRRINETATLSVTRAEQGFSASIVENPLETKEQRLTGAVDSSLYLAVNQAGGTDRLAVSLADVFKYDIDFVNAVRPGDRFIVTHEQQWQDGEFVRDGDILAAEFVNAGRTYRAVRYVRPGGRADYYTPDGRPVRKAFLRYPVDYARISSGYSTARWHPVLHRVRAHRGIDFAAPAGTPIKAAGAGRVIFRGTKGGYGNVVELAHSNGITTLYAHMSRFAREVGVGDRVAQGEVIGYVGRTGLANGPHVHYEYRVNGVYKNPARVTVPKADPIPANLMEDFRAKTGPLLASLDAPAVEPIRVARSGR